MMQNQLLRYMTCAGILTLVLGCPRSGSRPRGERRPQRGEVIGTVAGVTDLYRQAGFIAEAAPIAFIGSVRYLAGPGDTTLVLIGFSMANRALTFVREGDRYRAGYGITADLRQGGSTVRHIEAHEVVRVISFKETTRNDESVIFQQILSVSPGQYVLSLAVRDEGSSRAGSHEEILNVPRLSAGRLATPISVYEVQARTTTDSLPQLTLSPRSTATFGRDTSLLVYVEGYGPGTRLPLRVTARNAKGMTLWTDSLGLARRGKVFSGTIDVPVSRLGIGVSTLMVSRRDTTDSSSVPVLVTFGDDLAIASFEDMLSYLRYFTTPQRLKTLRDTAPEFRAAAWTAFLHESDPILSTPEHEGLREYFNRIQQANERFREEGIGGWLTDRGMVYVTLGEPDQILEQTTNDVTQRGRAQIWEYRQYHAQLIFIDQTGFGRWRITASSDADFQSIVTRMRAR
ncbi:MAG: GWxTD domain-containing protein [Nitrospiraceae bacterium]|nr:GWxTD domain-containing protein [Nitrospiraceae bacterium]